MSDVTRIAASGSTTLTVTNAPRPQATGYRHRPSVTSEAPPACPPTTANRLRRCSHRWSHSRTAAMTTSHIESAAARLRLSRWSKFRIVS